jgi:murein DD-endopeptidase MepM/ murein hydrolase activator NlpD
MKTQLTIALTSVFGLFFVAGMVSAERLDQTQFEKIVSEAINEDTDLQDDKEVIEEKSQEIKEVEERISSFEGKLDTLNSEKITLNNHLALIDETLNKNEEEIGKTKKEIDVIQLEIEVLGREIRDAEEDIVRKNVALSGLLQEMYIRDQMTPLEITVGSDSLSGYFAKEQFTSDVQSEVGGLLTELQSDREALDSKRTSHTEKKATLSVEKRNLDIEQEKLGEESLYQQKLLADVEGDEEKFQEILRNAQRDRAILDEQVSSLERKSQEQIDEIRGQVQEKLDNDPNAELTSEEKLVIADNVQFIWPVVSRVITCVFHCGGYPFENVFGAHSGLDVGLPQGSSVYASATGEVVFVRYPVDTSLAYVVIKHSEEFSTSYLHMSDISVSIGDFVEQGEQIGLSGGAYGTNGAGTSTGPHLHFEIIKNDLQVNPQDYLGN